MKNKISYSNKIALLIFFWLWVLLYGLFTTAQNDQTLIMDLKEKRLENNFSTIHFYAGGNGQGEPNDFGGGALWVSTQKKLAVPQEIKTENGSWKLCSVKLEGLYYNSQRGERLWPLDENTLASLKKSGKKYDDLSVLWGLYTSCGTGDLYSIYGAVQHRIDGDPIEYTITAGVKYDLPINRMQSNSPLHCTLQLVNNKTAVGYLYDSQGGIGFVGGKVPTPEQNEALSLVLNNGTCINDVFHFINENTIQGEVWGWTWTITNENSLENLKRNLAVRGIVGFTNDVLLQDKENVEWGFGEKSQTIRTTSLSLSNAVNSARKKAEQLCRGRRNEDSGSLRCFNNDMGYNIRTVDLIPGTTYVFQNIDAEINQYMNNVVDQSPVTVFIDGGKLILPASVEKDTLIGFNEEGYPNNGAAVREGNFLKGNFIVNGILSPSSTTGIQNKLYVHWKLFSLNTFDVPSSTKIDQISRLLGDGNFDEKWVDYRNLFTWNCENSVAWIANDGTSCQAGLSELLSKPISIIDMNFPSLLLE